MTRRPSRSVQSSPVLIGAVTGLVACVAVFLSYNANNGLPFVPSYRVTATVPDAAKLVAGNDVRIGGALVGRVSKVRGTLRRGRPVAVLDLKLDESVGQLPADTKVLIRQRSNIGLKYVELRPGRSHSRIADGGALPLANAVAPVDFDAVLGTFDRPTRGALRGVVTGLGGGLAGRGGDLNEALGELPRVTRDLIAAGGNLAAPETGLGGFFEGTAAAVAAVAPAAPRLRALFGDGATTFGAMAGERSALEAAIDRAPGAERSATAAVTTMRPLLAQATALARDARPGVRLLGPASSRLASALQRSAPTLGRARRLAPPVEQVVGEARTLAGRPATTGTLQRLTDVVRGARPLLTYLNPMQTKCNALGLWTRNVPSLGSEGDPLGGWFRFVAVTQVNEVLPHAERSPNLHYNPLPDTGTGGECEAGNSAFADGQQVGPVPGRQPLATEPTIPGSLAEKVAAEGDG